MHDIAKREAEINQHGAQINLVSAVLNALLLVVIIFLAGAPQPMAADVPANRAETGCHDVDDDVVCCELTEIESNGAANVSISLSSDKATARIWLTRDGTEYCYKLFE